MSPNLALSLLASALVGGVLTVVTVDDLSAIHAGATRKAAEVQAVNDAQTLEAAQVLYELSGGPANASVQELVDKGYLKPAFLTRQAVRQDAPHAEPASSQ